MGRLLLLSALLLAAVPACKDKDKDKDKDEDPAQPAQDEDNSFAEDGSDSNASNTDAQLVASSLVSSSPGEIGLASVEGGSLGARDVGDGVRTIYLPRGCAEGKKTADNEATYTFKNCFGPNGLSGVTGTVKARFTAAPAKLDLALTYENLEVNGALVNGTATAAITARASSRTMTWGAELTGETPRGKDFAYTSSHTVEWTLGEACFSLDGTTNGQVGKREIQTRVEGYERCRRGCPEAGGKITVTNVAKQKVVTIDFDGTATATYTAPNGRPFDLKLLCKE